MRKPLSFILILFLLAGNTGISFGAFTTQTNLSYDEQGKYKNQIDTLYEGFKNKLNKLDVSRQLERLGNMETKIGQILQRKLSDKNTYILSYIQYLVGENKKSIKPTTSSDSIGLGALFNDSPTTTVQTNVKMGNQNNKKYSIDEVKQLINEKFKNSGIKIEFFSTKKEIADKCLVTEYYAEYSDFWKRIDKIQQEVDSNNSGKDRQFNEKKDFLLNRMNYYIYIDPIDISKSGIYKDNTSDVDYLNFEKNKALLYPYIPDISYDFKQNQNGEITLNLLGSRKEPMLPLSKWGGMLTTTKCTYAVTKDSYKENTNLTELSNVVRLLNLNKGQLVYRMITEGYFLHLSQNLLDTKIITKNDIVDGINILRNDYGLSPLSFNENIATAARNHSKYISVNNSILESKLQGSYTESYELATWHGEDSILANFSGFTPSDRIKSAGYSLGGGEDIAFGANIITGIHDLLFVPYHRLAFISESFSDIGFYFGDEKYNSQVINFGNTNTKGGDKIIVFPVNNAELSIYSRLIGETPQPFPKNRGTRGTVITIIAGDKNVLQNSVKLTNVISGEILPIISDIDPTKEKAGIIHFLNLKPLELNKKYQISYRIEGENEDRVSYFYTGNKDLIDTKN